MKKLLLRLAIKILQKALRDDEEYYFGWQSDIAMAMYYVGADVHLNNTELAVEHNKEIVKRFLIIGL